MSRGRDPDALLRQRVVLIAGEIDDASATEIIAKMLYLEHLDRRRETYLYVNSQGGSVAAAMAIADTIRAIATPARTVCLGQAQVLRP
jgi:ATP-dependent Clp protease protease subunit